MNNRSNKKYFILLIVSVIVIWTLWFIYYQYYENKNIDWSSFNALSSLFSGLAFAGLVITIIHQHTSSINSTDLVLKQIKEMETQTTFLAKQTITTNFFEVLRFFNEQKESIGGTDELEDTTSRIENFIMKSVSEAREKEKNGEPNAGVKAEARNALEEIVYDEINDRLGSYINSLYFLLDFIDKQGEYKDVFIGLVKSNLSNNEKYLINFYLTTTFSPFKFLELVEKHNILEGYNESVQISILMEDIIEFYYKPDLSLKKVDLDKLKSQLHNL